MKRIQWGIIPLLMCLLFTACKDDDIVNRVEEGLPVSLNVKMLVPKTSDVQTNTRATDEVETNVEKLALLFYKYENSTPYVLKIPKDNLKKTQDGTSTNYFYSFTVTAEQMTQSGIMSGEYWVYALANWDKGFCTVDLNEVKKMDKAQLEDYCVLKTNNVIDLNETALLLTGKYEGPNGEEKVTLKPGDNKFDDFHLKRITAKIIFNFENGKNAEFVPTEYEIHNYSRSSTLIEREGWNVTNPGNLKYKGSDKPEAFNSSKAAIQLGKKPTEQITVGNGKKNYNFYFYMLENVQPAKSAITTYAEREQRVSASDRTFKNAPDRGTYVIVRGNYKGIRGGDGTDAADEVQGAVAYTIHLGDCSTKSETGSMDNFSVRRNSKYYYSITVTGVNSIIVEATTDDEKQPGAEGDIMKSTNNVYNLDAHFETVMLKLDKNKFETYSFLAVTPYGTYTQQVQDGTHADPDVEAQYLAWVKFGAPESSTAFKSYPGDTSPQLVNIYELMNEINDYINNESKPEAGWHFIEVQEGEKSYLYVTAYVDEYYYENEEDLTKFINAPDRRLALSTKTSQSADKESTYTESPIFAINQKSIQSIFVLDGSVTRPFGAETYEETPDAVLSSSGAGVEPSVSNEPRPNWGWRNLWEQLHGYNVSDHDDTKWATFVNASKNGHFTSNAEKGDELTFNESLQSGYQYALYQCFTRNRDEDGNGVIDVGEMKWYLPAVDECMAFWYGASALSDQVKFNNTATYFTSTNSTFRTWWALEGSATGEYKNNDAPSGKQRVRCIRTIGNFGQDWGVKDNEVSASIVDYDKTNRIIHMHDMGENTIRTALSQKGEYNPHDYLSTENKLPEAFQFAKNNLGYRQESSWTWGSDEWVDNKYSYEEVRTSDLCKDYYEEEGEIDKGQWRIPNQRELSLIHRYFRDGTVEQSSNLTDYTAARSTYYREKENVQALFFVQRGNPDFITTTWEPAQTGLFFVIRCVRDVDFHKYE